VAITSFEQLLAAARARGPITVAVAAADDPDILEAAQAAEQARIADCLLVGDASRIREIAAERDVDISRMMIVDEGHDVAAARKAMELVRLGHAQVAMKGKIETGAFLKAALDRETGLRTGELLTHVAVIELPGYDRLLFVSDGGVVVAPTLEQKVHIVRNAVAVAQALGVEVPKVAILAASEMVNPEIKATLDAANLAKMADRRQILGAIVDGPLALDNAISSESADTKHITSPVAGRADILIAPDVEAANLLAKAMIYFAKGTMCGVVVGASAPLVVASRSAPSETKLASIALGVLLC
jgi:phosphate butyryltransferase